MTNIKFILPTLIIALGAPALAGSSESAKLCLLGPTTPESYTWDFQAEATEIFDETEARAVRIRDHAANLESFTRDASLPSWQSHAIELERLKVEINELGQRTCRLEKIRRVAEPWQQQTIDRIRVRATNLASLTEQTLAKFNEWPNVVMMTPEYRDMVQAIYVEADQLKQAAERPSFEQAHISD